MEPEYLSNDCARPTPLALIGSQSDSDKVSLLFLPAPLQLGCRAQAKADKTQDFADCPACTAFHQCTSSRIMAFSEPGWNPRYLPPWSLQGSKLQISQQRCRRRRGRQTACAYRYSGTDKVFHRPSTPHRVHRRGFVLELLISK